MSSRLLVIAHRAANSVETLRDATAAGADWAEADVWERDGRLEVRHTKTMGPIPLLWDRWSLERDGPQLSLEQLLASDPGLPLMLDLKGRSTALVPMVSAIMDRLAPSLPYAVCSRNWALLDTYPRSPRLRILYSVGSRRQLAAALEHLTQPRTDGISIHARLLTADVVARLRARAGMLISWPINTPALAEKLRAWDVDGISVDRLAILPTIRAAELQTTKA